MTAYKNIAIEYGRYSATIWLSRPEKRNAIDQQMASDLLELLDILQDNKKVYIVIIRGKGNTFCAGADLEWMGRTDLPHGLQAGALLPKLFRAFYSFPKPLVAMVQGTVMGGALGLMASADFVLADENTQFIFSEVRLGLVPATISPIVIRRIGEFKARQFMLLGSAINTKQALDAGLIDHTGNMDAIEAHKDYLCNTFPENAPKAMESCKKLIIKVSGKNIDEELFDYTARVLDEVRKGAEAREGMRAFVEKRKPLWRKQ